MKIHILSDLHLEFGKLKLPEVDADVTVLAGDIGVGLQGIEWALAAFDRPVIYVMGNHEFYGQRVMKELWKDAREKVKGTHVHLLENESIEIGGVRFLGTTLWTDFALFGGGHRVLAMVDALALSDFTSITTALQPGAGYNLRKAKRLTPQDTLNLHKASRAWLDQELDRPFSGKTVVVTHHAPDWGSLAARWTYDPISPCFVSNLTGLVERADLWIHGHTHDGFDYQMERCRVVCNPRGYVNQMQPENPAFDVGMVVEL